MNPRQLSEELRTGQSGDLTRRRWIVGLSLVGAAMAEVVSLYQIGILKKLPDPPIPLFDSSKVDASTYAYKRFDTPDGLMMLANYGITAWLAGAGGQHRATQRPFLPVAMGVKTWVDAVGAAVLTQEEWKENKKLCFYCQVALVSSIASAVIAVPEMIKGIRILLGK